MNVAAGIKTTEAVLSWLAERTEEAQKEQDQQTAKAPAQMFLPGMEEAMRAMPNHIARSSLFAPVARGRKKYHDRAILVSRGDAILTFTGHQLDEAQSDIWMQLVFLARKTPLGMPVEINRAAFLRGIGRSTGKHDYQWLHRAMFDFTAAMITIEAKRNDGLPKYQIGHTKAFHMLSDFDYNADTETYTFTIDPRWKSLFGGREYALIDWNKRLQISQGQDMAKALQRLFATSDESPQRYALEWLKDKMQYASPVRKFRESLNSALCELKRLEIVARWEIGQSSKGKDQLCIWSGK